MYLIVKLKIMKKVSVNWFRRDLRLKDNPSLNYLSTLEIPILNLFILEDDTEQTKNIGSASKIWLHHALNDLNKQLDNSLLIMRGNADQIFKKLILKYEIKFISWNRCYEPWRIQRDKKLKSNLTEMGIKIKTFNGSLLWEPWKILKSDLTPYKVYSPFYKRGCLNSSPPRMPEKKRKLDICKLNSNSNNISQLDLLPQKEWGKEIVKDWDISRSGAEKLIETFFSKNLSNYKEGRNYPSFQSVSRLSPYIQCGQISVNELWFECKKYLDIEIFKPNAEHFMSELGWREFSYYLLYHFPFINTKNFQKKFDSFPWQKNDGFIKKWQKGKTGYPIVDAGMRELRKTGYMHNRVRMIVGSFLVKNLLIDWRIGEEWFWDNLFDADIANNSAGWQWVGGSGADAAPYFRIFNPITQGQKFDPKGEYTKLYLPELKNLPSKFLFNPWEAPSEIRKQARVSLGQNYPFPIVDIKDSRNKALEAFKSIKI